MTLICAECLIDEPHRGHYYNCSHWEDPDEWNLNVTEYV